MWAVIRVKGFKKFEIKMDRQIRKTVEIFVIVSISDMPAKNYYYNLGKIWIMKKKISLKNPELVINVLRHWQLLEEIYSQDIQTY